MTTHLGKAFTIQGALSDSSIVNTGSGSSQIGGGRSLSYLLIHNPNATNIGVNMTGLSGASVGNPGTVTLVPNGTLIYENGFIPTNAFTVCGSSGSAVTIYRG